MRRLLTGLGIFYALGIILADAIRLDFWLMLGVATAVLAYASLGANKKSLFLILVLFLALLAGCLNLKNYYRLPRCHIRNFVVDQDNSIYSVSGFVSNLPEFKNGHCEFTLRAQTIQIDKLKYNCCGELLVKMDTFGGMQTSPVRMGKEYATFSINPEQSRGIDFTQAVDYGENLTLLGNLSRVYSFNHSPGSYQNFLARQGIFLIMSIRDPRQILRQNGFGGVKLIKICFRLRAYLEQMISRHLPDLPASILSAMVLGQKRNIPWLVNNSMVKSGTVH
ncbi:MAG: DUF4131 domain-containing protein, partial [Candidatus Omnitrophota bacterium]